MPLLTPQHHQLGVSVWFLFPGLPWWEDLTDMPVPSGKAGLHSFSLVGPIHHLLPCHSTQRTVFAWKWHIGICDLARVWAYFPSPFTQGDFPVRSTEHTNQNLNYLNSESWGTGSSTKQFSVAEPCRSSSQTICDADQGFPVCAQLWLPVTSVPQSGWTAFFRASVLCHLPLIRTTILKSWCHSNSRGLSIRRLNLREMESSLYVRELERTGIVSLVPMTRL